MMEERALCLWILCSLSLLLLPGEGAVEVGHVLIQAGFVQKYGEMGELMFDCDKDEIFYVNSVEKKVVWRRPKFGKLSSVEAQGALGSLAVEKTNLAISIKRSNYTAAKNVPPEVMVFTENPVDLGEPNILICFMNKFFPPVINATWLKNGERVYDGVSETNFYPMEDASFRKFLYLAFVPQDGDVYTCSVDHWGQEHTVNKFWDAKVPSPALEKMQTMVCALGLAVGIIGITLGTVLIIKGMKRNNSPVRGRH